MASLLSSLMKLHSQNSLFWDKDKTYLHNNWYELSIASTGVYIQVKI